jgi:hypothetical protein
MATEVPREDISEESLNSLTQESSEEFRKSLENLTRRISKMKRKTLEPKARQAFTECQRSNSLMRFASQFRERLKRKIWQPPNNSLRYFDSDLVDSSPSSCFHKVPHLMGIYNCNLVAPPHMVRVGSWKNNTCSYPCSFSDPQRMDWTSEWTMIVKKHFDQQYARETFLQRGRSRSTVG